MRVRYSPCKGDLFAIMMMLFRTDRDNQLIRLIFIFITMNYNILNLFIVVLKRKAVLISVIIVVIDAMVIVSDRVYVTITVIDLVVLLDNRDICRLVCHISG